MASSSLFKWRLFYLCKDCGRQFIDDYAPAQGYADAVKRECFKLYVTGMGFRGIQRVKGVHHTTMIYWQLWEHGTVTSM